MASSTQYAQRYQQAVSAYMQGHYENAATWTDALLSEHPEDPNLQLLCGHIYGGLKQYDLAQKHYQQVIVSTDDTELIDCAQTSLSDIAQLLGDRSGYQPAQHGGWADSDLGFEGDDDNTQIQIGREPSSNRPPVSDRRPEPSLDRGWPQPSSTARAIEYSKEAHSGETYSREAYAGEAHSGLNSTALRYSGGESADVDEEILNAASDLFDDDDEITLLMGKKSSQKLEGEMSDEQFSGELTNPGHHPTVDESEADFGAPFAEAQENSRDEIRPDPFFLDPGADSAPQAISQDNGFGTLLPQDKNSEELDLLNNLEISDHFQNSEDLDLDTGFGDSGWVTDDANNPIENSMEFPQPEPSGGLASPPSSSLEQSLSSKSKDSAALAGAGRQFDRADRAALNISSQRLPLLAPFEDAPLQKKQLIMAVSTGAVSGLAVLLVSQATGSAAGGAKFGLGLAAGLAGGVTTLALSQVITRQLKASTSDLQTKLAAVGKGDWSVKAIEFSEDEFGQLAKSFNQMTHFIESTTSDAQRKAIEQEKAKEDLQRQVIRLLDDVEGAARGDLTVQAEVTADILGAVADSFNLTIYNLQKIVKQVKVAAREVNRGAADNQEFARGLSSDALRQAEELAATLNSVQMMTASIQEVADSARAADRVAQQASEAALRGGESVESTVAGILQIRETVAETTRKVKRLAESSQEISKIVGLISQIASRTNLLALNASIEAARAGESGRGFAVVADEVRQLADRAAKASKEIEQIVLQIQGETSSVMTAMEEGTQQVIEGTQRAEQAKHSLDDIIQVSDQIKKLVGSITKATSEQTETSRYVAQVMQSVELTAQETSQEAQRVSDSLRNLVGVARDLQSSVERFKVEGTEFN